MHSTYTVASFPLCIDRGALGAYVLEAVIHTASEHGAVLCRPQCRT